jgi:4-aminobutyrate aminotransferase-like enzyme
MTLTQTAWPSALYGSGDGPMMDHGRGVFLYDDTGADYLDAASGTFNLSLGYSHPAIVEAIQRQASRLIHASSRFQVQLIEDLAHRLVDLSPPNLTRVHLKSAGGSTSIEGAVRMAQNATGARDVVTLYRSHHGQTAMTVGMSGNAFRRAAAPVPRGDVVHVPDPYCRRCFFGAERSTCGLLCADRVSDVIDHASSGHVAAFVVEPVSGNGGNVILPDGYLQRIREICDARNIKLILDEVQTGIGRTGRMFAAEHFGVKVDAIVSAKGLGGSGAQISAILLDESLTTMDPGLHTFTFGGNILAAAAAVSTLEIVAQPAFLDHVTDVGAYLVSGLQTLAQRFSSIDHVRGLGLMIGFEIVDPHGAPDVALTNRIAQTAIRHRLLLRTSEFGRGNVVKIRPPLILTHQEADLLLDRLGETLAAVQA